MATCTIIDDLPVANLAELPYLTRGPFAYDNLAFEVEKIHVVNRLATDLSRPVSPFDSETEYVPTQYLADIVKCVGLSGLIYPSALASGKNVALFADTNVRIDEVKLYHVSGISYDFEEVHAD